MPAEEPREGERIGGHVLIRCLGGGGFATVWDAKRVADGRPVALKVLRPDRLTEDPALDGPRGPSPADRFIAEARVLHRLKHPGLVEILDVIDERARGRLAYAMERLSGYDLRRIALHLSLSTLLELFARVADALDYVHRENVIHRDVKLDNMFVVERAGAAPNTLPLVKLIDFGVAKDLGADTLLQDTATGMFAGTLIAMAPECFDRARNPSGVPLTGAVDQWSIGVALYQVLTGRLPFHSNSPLELIRKIQEDTAAPPVMLDRYGGADPPPAVAQVVLRCLEKSPAARYPSAGALAEALRGAAHKLRGSSAFETVLREAHARVRRQSERAVVIAFRDDLELAERTEPAVEIEGATIRISTDHLGAGAETEVSKSLGAPTIRIDAPAPKREREVSDWKEVLQDDDTVAMQDVLPAQVPPQAPAPQAPAPPPQTPLRRVLPVVPETVPDTSEVEALRPKRWVGILIFLLAAAVTFLLAWLFAR